MCQLHRKKVDVSPITLEELVALSLNGQGNKVHGRPVWRETESGVRELLIFDLPTKSLMRHEEFVSTQKRRARTRALSYRSASPRDARRYCFT